MDEPLTEMGELVVSEDLPDDTRIDTLNLSTQTKNALINDGCVTVGCIRDKSDAELMRTVGFGRVSLAAVRAICGPHNARMSAAAEHRIDLLERRVARLEAVLHELIAVIDSKIHLSDASALGEVCERAKQIARH